MVSYGGPPGKLDAQFKGKLAALAQWSDELSTERDKIRGTHHVSQLSSISSEFLYASSMWLRDMDGTLPQLLNGITVIFECSGLLVKLGLDIVSYG